MGHQIDAVGLLDLPEAAACAWCGGMTPTAFDDLDLDCASANPEPGVFSQSACCRHCDEVNVFTVRVVPEPVKVERGR